MAIERYGSKTDAVVKLVLVGFVCLLSFSIGTFVGKKFSDNQHRLAKFEPGHENESRGIASVASAETSKSKTAAMTDEEIAKLAEEFVTDDEGSESKADSKVSAKDSEAETVAKNEHGTEKVVEKQVEKHGTDKHVADKHVADKHSAEKTTAEKVVSEKTATEKKPSDQPLKVAQQIATDKKTAPPTVDPGKARVPSSLPRNLASSPIGKFTVQVGAYPTEEEATKQTERLKKEGLSAFFVEAKVKNGDTSKTWYRVSVGLFATKKEAESTMAQMMSDKKVPSAIVQQITK